MCYLNLIVETHRQTKSLSRIFLYNNSKGKFLYLFVLYNKFCKIVLYKTIVLYNNSKGDKGNFWLIPTWTLMVGIASIELTGN